MNWAEFFDGLVKVVVAITSAITTVIVVWGKVSSGKRFEEVKTEVGGVKTFVAKTAEKVTVVAEKVETAEVTRKEVAETQAKGMEALGEKVEVVHKATNSLTEKLVNKTEDEGHARGVADERKRADAEAGTLARGALDERARLDSMGAGASIEGIKAPQVVTEPVKVDLVKVDPAIAAGGIAGPPK